MNKKTAGGINPLSITTVYMEMFFDGLKLASGTAFFVKTKKGPMLITNRHNVTGRNQNTNEPLNKMSGIPNHARFKIIGSHEPVWYHFDLLKNDIPVWVEHSSYGPRVDVVGVLLPELKDIIHLYVGIEKSWYTNRVADLIHVIGYPFGMNDYFAIWATGYIASEPETNYNDLPAFLIDCRAREGQSGSLVVSCVHPGDNVLHKGVLYASKKEMVNYIGIYSGRINNNSDLGIVWKKEVLRDLVSTIDNSDTITDNKFANCRVEQIKAQGF